MKRTFAVGALFAAVILTWLLWPVPPRQAGEDAKHKHGGHPDEVVDAEALAIDPSSRSVTLRRSNSRIRWQGRVYSFQLRRLPAGPPSR